MAYQSEIELRVKVLDKDLKDLEKRLEKFQNPFDLTGKRKKAPAQAAAVRSQLAEAKLIKQSIDDLDRLRETKARKRLQTNLRAIRFRKTQAIKAEREIEREALQSQRRIAKARRDAASSALIGGAFPLLFGQGAGAALGGGLGGGLGGLAGGQFGFGLSLAGTAAGQAIDTLIAKAADLGKALDKTSLDIEAVTKAAGEVNKEAQTLIEETKNVAGAEEAAAAAARLLATQVGDDGVTALKDFADANKELNAAVSVIITNLSIFAATLLGPVAKGIAGLIQRANLASQVQRIREEGGPDAERLRAAFERGAQEGGTVDAGNVAQQEEALKILAERRQKELEATTRINLENSKALPIAEKEGEILKLKGGLLNENIYLKRKEIIQLEYEAKLNEDNITKLGKKLAKQERDNALQKLSNDRAAEAARVAEKANRTEERAQRQRKQRENQLLSAQAAEKAAANSLMQAELEKTKVFDGELAALRQRGNQITDELKNNLKILEIRKKQRLQNVKSVKEEKLLEDAYLKQKEALRIQADNQTVIVGLAAKRLELSRQQEKIDAERARRSQIEGVRQERFGFTAQLADPFNLNPERVLAAKSELRASQLLRAEREKLLDLKREKTLITPFASNEELDRLNDQIDAQEAFIPQLEAELALRNQLELAAARQSVIIEKYGFLANELSTAMTSAVQAVVTGTGTVEEAFSTMFANIGKAFIDMATQMLAQKLFMTVLGALGGGAAAGVNPSGAFNIGLAAGRANGGPVRPNSTYLVGERGPELLTMGGQSGYVHSNTSAAMDRYRAGGSRPGTETVNINYSVTEINGMRFVTEEEFRAGMDQAAKRGAKMGQTQTMSTLKNSRSQRSKIGL